MLLVLALGCADAGAQALYKLVDRNGKVTYSDTVPKDFKGRVIPLHIDPNLNSSESSPDDWIYVNPDRNPRRVRRYPKPEYAAQLVELERQAILAEQELDKLERARRIYP